MERDWRPAGQAVTQAPGPGDIRPVPCPPPLTALLHERGTGQLSESTYSRAWRACAQSRPDDRRVPITTRAARPPPAPRLCVHLAERRRSTYSSSRVGRAQRRSPLAGLRQVHLRTGGPRPSAHRGCARSGPNRARSARQFPVARPVTSKDAARTSAHIRHRHPVEAVDSRTQQDRPLT
jgi:hypothetical protein